MAWGRLLLVSVVALMCLGSCASNPGSNDQVILLSIQPRKAAAGSSGTTFHGYPVLGEGTLDSSSKGEVLDALVEGIADGPRNGAKCFIPRHGVRITGAEGTVEHVICFECFWVRTYEGEGQPVRRTIAKSPRAVFNRVLRNAGVPLAK